MMLEGTVVNGVIVLEGARVRVELDDPDDLAPPAEPFDRAQEMAILRQALEDVRTGQGIEAREFLKKFAEEHHLPLAAGEK